MNQNFEFITTLQYRVKTLSQQLEAFKSGEIYQKMDSDSKKLIRYYEHALAQKDLEFAKSHRETITVRKYWSEIMDDVEKEHFNEKEQLLKEYYEVATALEEEQGKNKKLTAQVNKDFENSSLPSSMKIGRKKITNSRKKTDRKPGGQPGHRGYRRKQYTPTECREIPAPEQYVNNPDFKATGRTI